MMGFVAEYMMKRSQLGPLMGQNSPETEQSQGHTDGKIGPKVVGDKALGSFLGL